MGKVRLEEETVWLTQMQMVELFNSSKQNISLHINNIFKEDELEQKATVKDYLTVQKEGNCNVKRKITCYNLDVIISVGYRVKIHKSHAVPPMGEQRIKGISAERLFRQLPLYSRNKTLQKQGGFFFPRIEEYRKY